MATTTSSIGISDESDNKLLSTTVSVKSGRKKVYEADAHIVEAFKEKYIKPSCNKMFSRIKCF